MRGAGLLLLAIPLAGCLGPRPAVPADAAVVPPPAWREALGPGAPVRADWWQGFGDPVLAQLIGRALEHNDDLAVAAGRVEEARANARIARAELRPEADAALGTTEGQTVSPIGTPSLGFAAQPQVSIGYDLDLFGRLRTASASARAGVLASQGSRDTVRLAVATSVATGYINLRALDLRLEVARETLAARAEGLRIARRRADTGYTSALELHQAEVEYHGTEQLVPQAELAIRRQENALAALLGDPPGAIARGLPLDRLLVPEIPNGLPADLLRRRPDLFQAEQLLVAADRSLDSARAALLPDISLSALGGVALSSVIPFPIGVYTGGGNVAGPLFDGGRRRGAVQAQTARRDQAAFSYRRAALQAFDEVDNSLSGVRRSGEQAAALAAQRDALAAALRNATNRYRAGYSGYIEQLDAERGLLSVRLALVSATADRLNAYATLYQAMGGGWSRTDVDAVRR